MSIPASKEELDRAYQRAQQALKPGDRVRVRSCAGDQTYTFKGWDGVMIDTASGRDLHPINVSRVNGVVTSFRDPIVL